MNSDELFQIFMQGLLTSHAGEAERCFRTWAHAVDMGDVDPRAVRLMPAFEAALKRHELPVPFPSHLKKFERYWWLNQKWLERSTQPAVAKLLEAGISVVALKGLSVCNAIERPAIRTMSDIDLWVPESETAQAVDIMKWQGFEVMEEFAPDWTANPTRFCNTHHALPMRNKELKMEVDLHWRLGGLISPRRSRKWWAEAAEKGPQIEGWPAGLRAMTGVPLVRTVMANGYMDAWSSGIWMLDVQALTAGWVERDWEELRQGFMEDRRAFMWNWCLWSLKEHGVDLPEAVDSTLPPGPAHRFRRMVYRGHWNDEAQGVFAWRWVRPLRSAFRLTWLHAQGEKVGRRWVVFGSFLKQEIQQLRRGKSR